MRPLRILLGDDHALLLNGVKGLLTARYEVVGTAENGRLLVEAAVALRPDIVILDVSMPLLNGIDAARQIKELLPATLIVFLSMHANPIYVRKGFALGASAYVLKSGAAEELLVALEQVTHGRRYVSPEFGADFCTAGGEPATLATRAPMALTERQRQILQLVAEGRHNKEIAEILAVSVKTVEFHRGRLMNKLGARSVAELTRYAIREGVIDPSAG